MSNVTPCDSINTVLSSIRDCEQHFDRRPNSVTLLAVSKTKPIEMIENAYQCGLRAFGENYAQELYDKAQQLQLAGLEWHFIGPLQSNKTRLIAESAHWMHSLDRLKIAERLSQQRPDTLPPLQVCLQVNLEQESSKSGLAVEQVGELAAAIQALPQLHLRGLMCIPSQQDSEQGQRAVFARLHKLSQQLQSNGVSLDTLSMGMSGDYQAAIAEGSTMIRVGTALFGARARKD